MEDNPENPSDVMQPSRSSTGSCQIADRVRDQNSLITPAPELRLRNAEPQPIPQNADSCQQESQSASQAIQQASQQASQSVQQAQQQASQSVQQAQQSASRAIQQAQNDASQSLQQASRSVSSISSSASSAMASLQSSAASALSQANDSAAQMAASAQVAASRAVVQAGAAIAAATGNGAAAGSAFLAKATPNTPNRPTAVSTSTAQDQRGAARDNGITPVQLAIAIVGSIIVSTLLSILLFYLVMRHKKRAKERADPRTPTAGQGAPMEKSDYKGLGDSTTSLALSPKASGGLGMDDYKRTSVAWNPSQPPKAPQIGGWLKAPEGVSPLGSIKLLSDSNDKGPLGGQLKSPLRFESPTLGQINPFKSPAPTNKESRSKGVAPKPPITTAPANTARKSSTRTASAIPAHMNRESKRVSRLTSSIWSDNLPGTAEVTTKDHATATKLNNMELPPTRGPIRNTAEWLAEQQAGTPIATPLATPQISRYQLGIPMRPGPAIEIKTVKVGEERGYVQGLDRFLGSTEKESLSRSGSLESNKSGASDISDLGVGKVLTPGKAM